MLWVPWKLLAYSLLYYTYCQKATTRPFTEKLVNFVTFSMQMIQKNKIQERNIIANGTAVWFVYNTTGALHTALHTGERGSGCDLSNKKEYMMLFKVVCFEIQAPFRHRNRIKSIDLAPVFKKKKRYPTLLTSQRSTR